MKKSIVTVLFLLVISTFIPIQLLAAHKPPKLVIGLVVDSLSPYTLHKIKSHLHGGLRYLLDKGIVCTNVHHPHAKPSTAVGHAALSTGTHADAHGIIDNYWFDEQGNKVRCDSDETENAAVFTPHANTYPFGISAHRLMADGLADQLMMASHQSKEHTFYALSLKSKPTVMLASRLGKGIWFDKKTGTFTTSKAYFDALPAWLQGFNNKIALSTTWQRASPSNPAADASCERNRYTFASEKKLIDTTFAIDLTQEQPLHTFMKTPAAQQLLFDLALATLKHLQPKKKSGTTVLWLSLSPHDLVAHSHGPHSAEAIDMLYHLDKQLHTFIRKVHRMANKKDTLFIFTADHACMPISEITKRKGLSLARRIDVTALRKKMNTILYQNFGIKNLVQHYKAPSFYLNMHTFSALENKRQRTILVALQHFLQAQPGIKKVWTYDELRSSLPGKHSFQSFFKHQLYPGRSGQLICFVHPYTNLTPFTHGTSHRTPYHYDTQVPLIFYRKGALGGKLIERKVWSPQVPVSLARLLHIPKPSASSYEVIADLFDTRTLGK